MIDAGKTYNAANKQFVNGIRELAQQSTKDEVIEVNMNMMVIKKITGMNIHYYNMYLLLCALWYLFDF